MCVITAYGVRCLVCWLLEVRCRAAGYAFGMRDVALHATSLINILYQITKKPASKLLYVRRKLLNEVNTFEGYHFTIELTSLHTCQVYRILSNKSNCTATEYT